MEAQEDVQQPRPETQEGPEAVELHVLQETPAPGETPVGDADEPSEERAAGVGTVPEGVESVTLEELQPGTLQDAIMGTHQALARLDGDTGTVSQADMQAAFGASGVAEIQAMMPILAQGMPSISQNQEVYEQLLMAAQPDIKTPEPELERRCADTFIAACRKLGLVNVDASTPVAVNEVLEGIASPIPMLIHTARGEEDAVNRALGRMPDNQRTGPLREAILAASKKREQFKQWLTRVNVAAGQERFNYDEISDRMLMRVKSHVLNDVVNKTNEAAKSVEFQWLTNHIVETSYDSGVGGGSMDETVRCSALDQTITKATGFARERTGRRKWCTHNEKFICGLTRESLAQNLRLSAKMMDDDTDTDASIKQLLARRGDSDVPMVEVVATLMTHDRLPSLTSQTGSMRMSQPLARRYARAAATGMLHNDGTDLAEPQKAAVRTDRFRRELQGFLQKPVPSPPDLTAANPPQNGVGSQLEYVQYLCEYAEMIAKASAYGGGWYGQSLLAQEVAHRLILRRSALKKNDEAALEWADLLYERTVAGNEATDTVLTGSSVLNALVVAPAPNGLNEETRVDIDALAAGADLVAVRGMDTIYVADLVEDGARAIAHGIYNFGAEVGTRALGMTESAFETLDHLFRTQTKTMVAVTVYYGLTVVTPVTLFAAWFPETTLYLIQNVAWVPVQATTNFLTNLTMGTFARLCAAASQLLNLGWTVAEEILWPLLARRLPLSLAWALTTVFSFGWYGYGALKLYRILSTGQLRIAYRRPPAAAYRRPPAAEEP